MSSSIRRNWGFNYEVELSQNDVLKNIQKHIIQREESGRCNAMGGLIEELELSVDCQEARRATTSLEGAEWPGGAES